MATKVHMEALSPTMEEGQVVKWLKKEGDSVTSGDVLAEIETDKATMELVARGDGVLRAVMVPEGGTAAVGDVIGVIAAPDEDIGELATPGAAARTEAPGAGAPGGDGAGAAPASAAIDGAPAPAVAEPATPAAQPPSGNGRIKASPVARRLAEEAGLDLGLVSGSGPGGRIVKKDIEAALAAGGAAAVTPVAPRAPTASAPQPTMALEGPEWEDLPLSQMRKTIARRLTESIGPVPHFFLNIHVDMTRLLESRKRVNAMLEASGEKVSINDFLIKATAIALTRHPACNVHWGGDFIRRHNRVHIGVAVAVDEGLITPVIRNANLKGVAQIGREVKELAGRAREKKLLPDEYTGATFSISNLGMFGIHEFTAVINPPEGAILAIGGIEDVPVLVDGELRAVPRMTITMSCDHRAIDGATGSRFLQTLKAMMEDPVVMMV